MRAHEIIFENHTLDETLTSFDTVGDVSRRNYLYKGNQAEWVSSSAQVEKLQQFLSRTPYNFRIFLSNQLPSVRYQGSIGKAAAIDLVGAEAADKIFSSAEDNITLIKVGNFADPLTPWLLTHQIAEAFENDNKLNRLRVMFYGYLNKIIHECYGLKPTYKPKDSSFWNINTVNSYISNRLQKTPANLANPQGFLGTDYVLPSSTSSVWVSLIRAILTFGSARHTFEVRPFEMYKELIVQYLNTGGEIRLNPLPEVLDTPEGTLQLQPNAPDLLTQMKENLTIEITRVLNNAVGKVYALVAYLPSGNAQQELIKKTGSAQVPDKFAKYGLRGLFRESESSSGSHHSSRKTK